MPNVFKEIDARIERHAAQPLSRLLSGVALAFGISLVPVTFGIDQLRAPLPERGELIKTQGLVSFGEPRRRQGAVVRLTDNAGNLIIFDCRASPNGVNDCVPDTRRPSLHGRQAVIWWHPTPTWHFLKNRLLFQLEVDDVLIVSYDDQLEQYRSERFDPSTLLFSGAFLLWAVGVATFGLIALRRRARSYRIGR